MEPKVFYDGINNKRILSEEELFSMDAPDATDIEEDEKRIAENIKFVEGALQNFREAIRDLYMADFPEEKLLDMVKEGFKHYQKYKHKKATRRIVMNRFIMRHPFMHYQHMHTC